MWIASSRTFTAQAGCHVEIRLSKVVNMSSPARNSYQTPDGLERAVVDLVRVGARGHSAGVRQLASRLMRATPIGVKDTETFRDAVHEAMVSGLETTELRYSHGSVPTEKDSALPLVDIEPSPYGEGLVLADEVMAELQEVLVERLRADELRRFGLRPTSTVLLSGPPGVGKTMTAHWLAQSLQLPLITLDLSSVVSSYLGSSGRNIKTVLDFAKSGPSVLLLDEFDAIAKRRDDESDIGELKRIVNVVLMELDHWPDTSLLVAATNHPQLLDTAVERRFDRSLRLTPPRERERRHILDNLAVGVEQIDKSVLDLVAELTTDMTSADLTSLWSLAHKRAILNTSALTDELVREVARRARDTGDLRDKLFLALRNHLGMSNRQIAALVGVTHPTVAAGLRRAE